jgi:hypothetical protein
MGLARWLSGGRAVPRRWSAEERADAERYLRRAACVEAAPDVTALLAAEALGRRVADVDAAAQRLTADADDGQWAR